MVGGGIFAVLGLSVDLAHGGAPIAFLFAGIVALVTAYSYAHVITSYSIHYTKLYDEAARLVGRGGDHAPLAGVRTDHNGQAPVLGVFQLLAAREECIQVHVGDPARCLSGVSHGWLMVV